MLQAHGVVLVQSCSATHYSLGILCIMRMYMQASVLAWKVFWNKQPMRFQKERCIAILRTPVLGSPRYWDGGVNGWWLQSKHDGYTVKKTEQRD